MRPLTLAALLFVAVVLAGLLLPIEWAVVVWVTLPFVFGRPLDASCRRFHAERAASKRKTTVRSREDVVLS